MKILVLSFYYRPDLCAGAFRVTPLVEEIRRSAPAGSSIDVVTTVPNRYHSFSVEAPEHEHDGMVSITRIALTSHRSGMVDQSRAFLSFARHARRAATGDYDLVFATSSRLMTAVLGAWLARRARATLYLDIRDIFVDTIGDVAARPVAWLLAPFLSQLERWAVNGASTVNLVSRGFQPYFERRYPGKRLSFYTNGIDDEFIHVKAPPSPAPPRKGPVTVLYAGNLGEGQGLHLIIPELAKRMLGRVRFLIVGDGGRKAALQRALTDSRVTNVELMPPVSRERLLELYREADVLFLHLNDHDAFKKVLPSKIFEYAALGKPVWGGIAGYAADFVAAEVENSAVFPPCDVDAAERSFAQLAMTHTARETFVSRFARAAINRDFAHDILAAGANGR